MASPGQLVDALAEAFNMPTTTVAQFDRMLAESGLRSAGGRGLSAASVTARDAANLLIAITGAFSTVSPIKDAAATVRYFGGMQFDVTDRRSHKSGEETRRDIHGIRNWKSGTFSELRGFVSAFADLSDFHTFADGLTALIEAVRRTEIQVSKENSFGSVSVSGYGPSSILLYSNHARRDWTLMYLPKKRASVSGLFWTRHFLLETVATVADVLNTDRRRLD